MVDLAKIRRKVKEKKDGEARSAPAEPLPESAAPAAAEPKKPGKAKAQVPEPNAPPPEAAVPPAAPVARAAAEERASAKLERFRETAGRLSEAMAASAGVAPAEQDALLQLLTFVMAEEQYAIDIEKIAEIIAPRQATPVPNAPAPVVGIISLRGTIVTMLDLRRELGHGPAAAIGPETRTIVVDDSGSLAGFMVDRVLRKVEVRPEQIQAHPVVSPAEQSDAIRGVFQSGTSLTIVLDVEKLLARG